MNCIRFLCMAMVSYISGDPLGAQLSSNIFYVLGPLLIAVGTLLRRSLPRREQPVTLRPRAVRARTMPLDSSRHSGDGAAKTAPQRRHANAM